MDRFRKDALFILNLINNNDKTHWYSKNDPYKWFFIRIEQYLNAPIGSTPKGQYYYNKSIEAQQTSKPHIKNNCFFEIVEALKLNII